MTEQLFKALTNARLAAFRDDTASKGTSFTLPSLMNGFGL